MRRRKFTSFVYKLPVFLFMSIIMVTIVKAQEPQNVEYCLVLHQVPDTPLFNTEVGHAILLGVDYEQIQANLNGKGTFARGVWNGDFVQYDPDSAKKLLDNAGYANGLNIDINYSSFEPAAIAENLDLIGQGIQANLSQIGVNVQNISPTDNQDVNTIPVYLDVGASNLCGGPYFQKLPLSLQGLLPSQFPIPVNNDYVIGFMRPDGRPVIVGTPVTVEYQLSNSSLGQPVGLVWSFDQGGNINSYVATIISGTQQGYLLDFNLSPVKSINYTAEQLYPQYVKGSVPVDMAIQADGVCFVVLNVDAYGVRYCSDNVREISPKAILDNEYESTIVSAITTAEDNLSAISLESPVAEELKDAIANNLVQSNMAVSEIEQPDRINKCKPASVNNCSADVIAAPIQSSKDSTLVGILVVTQELNSPLIASSPIAPGSYVIHTDIPVGSVIKHENNDINVMLSGVTDAKDIVSSQPINFSFPAFVNDSGDIGRVSISGLCFIICICNEKRR